jgi:uncharacterized membrane protein
MGMVIFNHTLLFSHPWLLLTALVAVPMVALAWRSLASVGPVRRWLAAVMRVLVVLLLAVLLADPVLTQTHDQVTVIAVVDRSQSVPPEVAKASVKYLTDALARRRPDDRVAVIDAAEVALIEKLANRDTAVHERVESLTGEETNLSAGVQLGLAIAPPNTAVRVLVASDGNETSGDLREAARVAAANHIPIDVLPLRYHYDHEVVFTRLVSPPIARVGETAALRFVLSSTGPARGKIYLSLNGKPVELDPGGEGTPASVQLKAGTNVKTVSLPIPGRGLHKFEATFVPDDPSMDSLVQNNKASSLTYVSGPGHVLVVDEDGVAGASVAKSLAAASIDTRHIRSTEFPQTLADLLDTDAIVLASASCADFTHAQQELLVQYVKELGGGFAMVGGPESFGAGGWIGSPVAEILPLDMDPPQKKNMPKGALVLIMHACEMPQGNYWGKEVALAAVNSLSRLDLAGVISYSWNSGKAWDFPLGPIEDKSAVNTAIQQMAMGDMPDFGGPVQTAYDALVKSDAVQRHIIIISDGDPSMPSQSLLDKCKEARITITGVAVFPHDVSMAQSLKKIADETGGRFYHVRDPNLLPQIFIKEAQVVHRALINEPKPPVAPKIVGGQGEILRGLGGAPPISGYVLTGPKGGASELLMTLPVPDGAGNMQEDPILAAWQVGVGRCVALTTSADSRWAPQWLAWGGFNRFWEQTIRWVARSRQPPDCVIFTDVQGRQVTITAEGMDRQGNFVQFTGMSGRVIGPDMDARDLVMSQVGPGQYRATFAAGRSGSYLVNLKYQKAGGDGASNMVQAVVTVPYAPEFRDLADNAPLLEEVARETGGRVLPPDPEGVDLFDRAGLVMPSTPLPLTKPLLFVWLAMFLTDVAVRRLAFDFRAMAAGAMGLVWRRFHRAPVKEDERLEQLRSRKKKVRDKVTGKGAESSRRFEAPSGAAAEMPDTRERQRIEAEKAEAARKAAGRTAGGPAPGGAAGKADGGGYMDQLKKARERARKGMGKDKEES